METFKWLVNGCNSILGTVATQISKIRLTVG